jgi:hypothetical protein
MGICPQHRLAAHRFPLRTGTARGRAGARQLREVSDNLPRSRAFRRSSYFAKGPRAHYLPERAIAESAA